MTTNSLRRCCGFTLIESAVVAALFAIFVAILISRVHSYHAEAERVAAEQLVGTIRTALQVRAAKAVIESGDQGLLPLLEENPLGWLQEKPANYLGEYYAPEHADLPPGNWYFDRADRTLVYLFGSTKSFSSRTSIFLKFKVKFTRSPTPAELNRRTRNSTGLVFDQVSVRNAVNNKDAG
ncbi:MAG TPA: type II secretion system protein [Telluria sp.]